MENRIERLYMYVADFNFCVAMDSPEWKRHQAKFYNTLEEVVTRYQMLEYKTDENGTLYREVRRLKNSPFG